MLPQNPTTRWMDAELAELDRDGLRRRLRVEPRAGGRFIDAAGREILNFSSNDYLNLAGDARLIEAARAATGRWGTGATGSRLMSGHLPPHAELEDALARLVGRPAALFFGSGFLTNAGVVSALAGPRDAIVADKLIHASLVDGARLSGARLHRYRHCDPGHLDQLLARESGARRRLVITDSVFSMDGDRAPLEEVARVARRHGAMLLVDEAHAIGVLGPGGGGLCRELPAELSPDVVVGTLSKSLGGYGGFATGSPELKEFLINRARTFIFSTGLPPAVAAAGLAAVQALEAEPGLGEDLMRRARLLAALLRERGLNVPEAASPILPVPIGDNHGALAVAERLRERGLLAVAVRPPTVPAGTARLRLSVTLAHREEDLARAAGLIAEAVGFAPQGEEQ